MLKRFLAVNILKKLFEDFTDTNQTQVHQKNLTKTSHCCLTWMETSFNGNLNCDLQKNYINFFPMIYVKVIK